ncbi:MAG: ABC transporter ATP-binding protein [Anaerolineae bacterium]|nr:ABC transporter ATP-binding protein [Anaerolineae bacterium]
MRARQVVTKSTTRHDGAVLCYPSNFATYRDGDNVPGSSEQSVADRVPLIELEGVVKTYHTAAGQVPALAGIDAAFYPGEFVGIVGKSGAGKSTLVNVLTGVDRVTFGQIRIGGATITALDEDQVALWRGRNVGVIYQSFELLPQLSLLDNVMLPMDLCGRYRPQQSLDRAQQLLAQVGLAAHVRKPPTRISGGQKQRVAIARALANDPPIIVADEPTGNLDSVTADEILALFEKLVQGGKTVIMVTHDLSLRRRFSRVVPIADGRLETPDAVARPSLSREQ